jgi:hypothetical protein
VSVSARARTCVCVCVCVGVRVCARAFELRRVCPICRHDGHHHYHHLCTSDDPLCTALLTLHPALSTQLGIKWPFIVSAAVAALCFLYALMMPESLKPSRRLAKFDPRRANSLSSLVSHSQLSC